MRPTAHNHAISRRVFLLAIITRITNNNRDSVVYKHYDAKRFAALLLFHEFSLMAVVVAIREFEILKEEGSRDVRVERNAN